MTDKAKSKEAKPKETEFKENDRVKRKAGSGCLGVVKDIRQEVTASSAEVSRPRLIKVQWDNGTLSYFSPEALEISSK